MTGWERTRQAELGLQLVTNARITLQETGGYVPDAGVVARAGAAAAESRG
jgi:hypothetical protein